MVAAGASQGLAECNRETLKRVELELRCVELSKELYRQAARNTKASSQIRQSPQPRAAQRPGAYVLTRACVVLRGGAGG